MNQPEWKPYIYRCISCGDLIFSKYPGHFASCSCNKSYVDQTHFYTRAGGEAEPVEEEQEKEKE